MVKWTCKKGEGQYNQLVPYGCKLREPQPKKIRKIDCRLRLSKIYISVEGNYEITETTGIRQYWNDHF